MSPLSSRHLPYQSVEHGALGQVEGRCVVHQGVAAVGQLHFRAGDDDALHAHLFIYVVVSALLLLDEHAWQLEVAVAGYVSQAVGHGGVLVAVGSGADDVVGVACRHLELVVRRGAPRPAGHGVDDAAVAAHQRHVCLHLRLGERVVYLAHQLYLSLFLLCGFHRVGLCSCRCRHDDRGEQQQECVSCHCKRVIWIWLAKVLKSWELGAISRKLFFAA